MSLPLRVRRQHPANLKWNKLAADVLIEATVLFLD